MRLNAERLQGDRGIQKIEDHFKDFKFAGKGHEKSDLNKVMKNLEHWAHRLYPAYNFDDFISKTEQLGKKKQLQTHMYRYRHNLLEPQMKATNGKPGESDEENGDINDGVEPIDEFDDLIGQQIEKYKTAPPKTPAHETTFDSVRSSIYPGTPTLMQRNPVEASTPWSNHSDIQSLPATPVPSEKTTKLTSDQMARIAENRRLAQERLKAKREAAELAAAVNVPPVSPLDG